MLSALSNLIVRNRKLGKSVSVTTHKKTSDAIAGFIHESIGNLGKTEDEKSKLKDKGLLTGLLILYNALERIDQAGNIDLFRSTTEIEMDEVQDKKTEIGIFPSNYKYYFFETYGLRFTILINAEDNTGLVTNLKRIMKKEENTTKDCLRSSEQVRLTADQT